MNAQLKQTLKDLCEEMKKHSYLNKTIDSTISTMGELRDFIDEINSQGKHYFFDLHNFIPNAYVCLIRMWTQGENNYCEVIDLLNHTLIGTPNQTYEDITSIEDYLQTFTKYLATEDEIQALQDQIDKLIDKVYTVRFYGSSTTGVRRDNAVGKNASIGYAGEEDVVNDFDHEEIFKDMVEVKLEARNQDGSIIKDSEGNTVYNKYIKIPNFYFRFRKGTDSTGDYDEYSVARIYHEGYTKIFGDKEYVLLGKYFTTPIPNSSLYGSVSGQKPRINISQYGLNDSMAYVKVGNTMYRPNSSESYLVWCAVAYLFMIEFATRNCQSIMNGIASETWTNLATDATTKEYNAGKTTDEIVVTNANSATKADHVSIYGLTGAGTQYWKTIEVTDKSVDTPVNGLTTLKLAEEVTIPSSGTCIICCNTGTAVGSTDNLLCSSGYAGGRTDTLAVGLRHFRYRGIEDVWGAFWNILCDYAYKITYDAETTTYTRQTIKRAADGSKTSPNDWAVVSGTNWTNNDGYVKQFNVVDNTLVAEVTTGGSSTTYYSDYHYRDAPTSATNYRCFVAGGHGDYGAGAGLFCFYCYGGFTSSTYSCAVRSFLYIV